MIKNTVIICYEKHGENTYPVILCEERKDVTIKGMMEFYCKYCKIIHRHGLGEGHRVAHCIKETPFIKSGYIITLNKNHNKKDIL